MIGKEVLEIGAEEFLDGPTTSPYTNDGGYSSETVAVNVISDTSRIGVLYPPSTVTDKSTNLNGYVIATCNDSTNSSAKQKYLLTSTGYVLSSDSNNDLTVRQNDAGRTYQFADSDIVSYKGDVFATSTTNVMRLYGGTTLPSMDATWWTGTRAEPALTSGVRHPMIVYEDNMWIADDEALHKWDGSSSTDNFLVLTSDQSITALGIDPSSGYMLIATTQGQNASSTLPKINRVLMWDGFSSRPLRSIPVDDMVTAFYNLGGNVFVFYGINVGYWNGAGITMLAKRGDETLFADNLVYKHKVTSIGNILFFADGKTITAYTDVLPGKKRFYNAHYIASESNDCLRYSIFNMGNDYLGIGYGESSTPKFAVFDISSRSGGSLAFYSKKYNFKRPVSVRSVWVEYADQVTANTTPGVVTLYGYDTNGQLQTISMPSLTNTSNSYTLFSKLTNSQNLLNVQAYYYSASTGSGVKRILIYYDYAE